MRRLLLALALLFFATPAVQAGDGTEEEATVEEMVFEDPEVWSEAEEETSSPSPYLPNEVEEAAAQLARRMHRASLRVDATAYAFDALPPELEDLLLRPSPVLSPEDRRALGARVREGGLRLLHAASAAGPLGTVLVGHDLEKRNVVFRREIESAQGVVVSFPRTAFVRVGLRLRATVEATAAGGASVAYVVALAEAPMVEPRPSLGGELDRVTVPALLAEGTLRLVPGESAAVVRVAPDGSGRLVLLSLQGELPDVSPVMDLARGYVAVLAGHLGPAEAPRTIQLVPGAYAYDDEHDGTGFADVLERFATFAGISWLEAQWQPAPLGLGIGSVAPADRARLAELLVRSATLRGAQGRIDVAREGWGRLSVPVAPGSVWRFFAGEVGTRRSGMQVESGCNHSVLAAPSTDVFTSGLLGAGRACVDRSVDVTLLGREVLAVEHRPYALRRIEDGYRSYARDAFVLPLVKQRILDCRSTLPPGATRLPGGVELAFVVDPPREAGLVACHVGDDVPEGALPVGGGGCLVSEAAAEAARAPLDPVRLTIGDEPFAVRPRAPSRFGLVTYHPFVRRWESEGWCGMRARYPVPDAPGYDYEDLGVREGPSLELRAWRDEGGIRLDLTGEIRGAPEDLGTFDPGDGPVRLVRSPRLWIELPALPLCGAQRLAFGAGLTLDVACDEASGDRADRREITVASNDADDAGLCTSLAGGGRLDAGAHWIVPSSFELCSSSHATAQISTAFGGMAEGVRIEVEASESHPRVGLRIRARPTFETYPLEVHVEPERPETDLQLLAPRQWRNERVLYLDEEGRLRFENPDPTRPYEVSARVVPAGGDK